MKKRNRPRHRSPSTSSSPVPTGRRLPPGSLALAGAILGGSLLGAFRPGLIAAQDPAPTNPDVRRVVRRFDIAPGNVESALEAFQAATGIKPRLLRAIPAGVHSPGVTGVFTPEDALRRLLERTYLTFRFEGPLEVAIFPAAPDLQRDRDPVHLEEVTVTAAPTLSSPKFTAPLTDQPQTVAIVPARLIEQQGATSLREVLRNVPGITINAGEGGATPGDNFNIRGFSARGDMFVDGMRDLSGYSRESFNLEQVEVAKGPASAYSGRGSTGGSINAVTKLPSLRQTYRMRTGIGGGDYRRATADINQPLAAIGLPTGALRINALYHDAGVPGVELVSSRNWGLAPSVAFGLGTSTPVTLTYYHLDVDALPAYGIQSQDSVPQALDTRRFFGLVDRDHERVETDQLTARVEHAFGGSLRFRNQLGWSQASVDRVITFANFTKARSSRSHVTEDRVLSNQANLTATFRTGSLRHSLSTGIDYSREKGRWATYQLSTPPAIADLDDPNPYEPVTGTPALNDARISEATNLGVYAFETVQIGRRWELSGGLRWDNFDPTWAPPPGGSTTPPPPASASVLNWRAGAVFKPSPGGSVYAAYSTSFNPSVQNLAYDQTSTLDPERNRSIEVGTKWSVAGDRLVLAAALFRTDKTNARTSDPDDPALGTVLEGEQRVQGIELSASGSLSRAWEVFAGYTLMDSEILASRNAAQVGLELPNTPKHSLSLWTTYRFPGTLEIGAGGRHVGDRLLSLSRATRVPGYWTFDATAGYRVLPGLELKVEVHNIGDELYYDNGRFWSPAAGRSVRFSTAVDF